MTTTEERDTTIAIPERGLSRQEVFRALESYRAHDAKWREGKVLSGLYDPGREAEETIRQAYASFLTENTIYPNFYPSLVRLECEVVRMLAELLRGDEGVVGNVTSGGTESIMLAVKTARDGARARARAGRGLSEPEIVLPVSAHPAFHKAAHYLGLKPIVTGIDTNSFRAEAEAMEAAITPNTVLLVASAPCYSHGTVDPVREIGEIALRHGLPLHVDACVGGVHLSFMRLAGYEVPDFDFAVPGVSTVSVDMHKYGYAAKNASVLLYRTKDLRRHAIFANASTTEYAVINTTVLSSRSGGPIAGAWAALNHLGKDGYLRIVREVTEATRRMTEGVEEIPEVRVLGEPDMCMFTMASETINVFELDDELARHGWHLIPQFSAGGGPANLHASVNLSNVGHVEDFLKALRESVRAVKAKGGPEGDAADLKAQVERLMRRPDPAAFAQIAKLAGVSGSSLPDGYARINTVLDALPDPMAETLLAEYFNDLYA